MVDVLFWKSHDAKQFLGAGNPWKPYWSLKLPFASFMREDGNGSNVGGGTVAGPRNMRRDRESPTSLVQYGTELRRTGWSSELANT